MKFWNNIKRILEVFIFCTYMILILSGFNLIKPQNTNIIKYDKQKPTNKSVRSTHSGNWQLISRARYIKGTIVSLKQLYNGKNILSLKVEVNYHGGTDPVDNKDYPFKVGEVVRFVLKNKPKINISNYKRVIIYQGQITTNGKDDFLGAEIKYFEKKSKYFDMNGKAIGLPPHDYPNSL